MAGMTNGQIKIPVSIEANIANLKDIRQQYADALSNVKPDEKSYKTIEKIIGEMDRKIQKMTQTISTGFTTPAGLNRLNETFQNTAALGKQIAEEFGKFGFENLNLNNGQLQQLNDYSEQIQTISKKIDNLNKKKFQELAKSSTTIKEVLEDLAINVNTSSLDEALKKIKEKEDQLDRSINGAQQKIQTAQTERDAARGNINKYNQLLRVFGRDADGNEVSSRVKDRAALGEFFTTKGTFRKKGKEAFKKYLKEQFALSDEDLNEILQQPENQLSNGAEKLIEEITKARNKDQGIVESKTNTIRQQSGLVQQYTEQKNRVTQARDDLNKGFKEDTALNKVITSLQGQITQLEEKVEQYKAALLEASGVSGIAAEGVDKLNGAMEDNRQATLDAAEAQARVNEQTAKMNRIKNTIAMWFGFNQILNLSRRAIRAIVSDIRELDKVMTEIAVVTNMSQSDLWNQMGTYQNIAKTYGVNTAGVYQVSQLYYQQGLQTSQVMQLTTETLKMAKIAGLDYATATDYMTVAIRGFKMEMSDAQRVVDVYSKVAAVSASDTEELAVAMSKTASSAAAVGSSFENTTAMLAMMIETTRESAENLGSAMKSIISRYGELKSNPSALIDSEGEALSLNKVDTALQSVGIKLHDAQGQFRDFDEVILELSEKWDTLDKNSQRYIATIMAGNRQQSRFLALVSDYDRLKELTEQAVNSEDAALVQTLKTMDSLETKIQNVKNAFQGFYGNLGLESLFKGALDIVTNILNRLNQLPKLGKKIPVLAVAIGAQIMNVIKLLLNSAVSLFAKEWTTIGDIIRNNIVRGHKEGVEEGKKQLEKEKSDIEGEQLPTGKSKKWMNPVGIALQALGSVTSINALARKPQDKLGFTGRGLQSIGGGVLSGAGGALMGVASNADKGLPGMIIGGLMGALTNGLPALITGINDIANAEKLALNAMKDRADQAKQDSILAKAEVRDLDTTITKLKTLEDARYSSNEAYQEWIDYKNQIVDTYPELLARYDAEGNAVIDLADSYIYLAEKRQAATLAQLDETEASLDYQKAAAEEIDKILTKARQNTYVSSVETDARGQGLKNLDEMQYVGRDILRESGNQNIFKASFANGSHVGFTNDMFNLLFNYAGDLSYGFQDSLLSLNLDNLDKIKNLQADDTYNKQEIHDIQQLYGNLIYGTYIKPLAESEIMKEGPYSLDKITKEVERIFSEGKERKLSDADIEANTFNYYMEVLSYFLKEAERLPELQQQIAEIEKKKAEINNSFTSSISNKMVSGNSDNYYLDQIAKSPLMQALNQHHMENSGIDIGTEEYTTEQDEFVDELVKIYKDRGKEVFDEISSILSRTDQYTSQSAVFDAIKKIYGEDIPETINDDLIDYINQTWENNNKDIQDNFRRNIDGSKKNKNIIIQESANKLQTIGNDLGNEVSAQYLNAINSQWSDLVTNETNEITAIKNAKFLAETYTKIAQLPQEANNALAGIMSGAELDTVEGIQAAIDAMEAYEAENADKLEESDLGIIKQSIQNLTEHKNNLFINTSLAVQRYINGLSKSIEDANKIYKVQTGGTDDFAEMQTTLDKINSTKTDKMGFDEVYKFDETLGKFVFTVEGLREAQKANLEAINDEWNRTSKKIDDNRIRLENLYKSNPETESGNIIDTLIKMSQDEDLNELDREYYSELAKNYAGRVETWDVLYKLESENLNQAQENGEQANEAAQKLLAQSSKVAAFKAVDFTKIADGTISFAEAENNLITLLSEIYPDLKEEDLLERATSAYNLISKGGANAVTLIKFFAEQAEQEIQSSVIEALLEQPFNTVKNAVNSLKGSSIGEAVDLTSLQNVLDEASLKKLFGDNYADGVLTINEEVASTMLNSLQSLRGMLKDQSQRLEVDKVISEYYSSSISELNKFTAGMVASSNLAAVLANNDFSFSSQLQLQGQIVLKTAKDFIYANQVIYESASKAYQDNTVNLSNLNTSFLNYINANLLQNTSSMSILSSASSFDLNALNEFLTVYGERLDDFVDELGEVTNDSAGIQAFGNGKYRIVDWDKFREKFAANLSETSEEYIDAYISFLTNSQDSKVNSKEALMTTLLPKLDSLTYAEIGQIAKRFGLTVDTVISYLEQNADGTFNGNALINELDFNKYDEAFVKALNERESNIATDMVSAIVAFSESSKGLYDNKVLGEAIDKYNKALQSLGKTTNLTLFDAERILLNGGEQAVALAEQIARAGRQELSAQDIETIYRGAISKLTNAIDTIAAQEGAIVDKTTADIIAEAGGQVNELGETGQFVVEKAANLYEAYKNLLDQMAATGKATLADLNKVAALALENKDRAGDAAEQQVIDALGDAAGMTYTRFGEILAQQGKELSEDLVIALEQSGVIKSLGGSRMMITDFSSFAEIMNWSADSEQYVSAFKSYNDSLIQMNRQAENNIFEEVKKVGDAKGGDWVNLTQLSDKLNKIVSESIIVSKPSGTQNIVEIDALTKLNQVLQNFGGKIEDGILKLDDSANIPAIMQKITQAAAQSGGLLSDELAELADTVADTIKGYADLIKGAIKGSLTNVQAEQLQDWATQVGIGQLDFTPTKEGLKIATDQAIQLYQELSKIDSIQGQLVFDDLVSALSSDKGGRFENASTTAAEIAKTQEKIKTIQATIENIEKNSAGNNKDTLENLRAQKLELQEQLNLYREIQQAQSLDPSRYNFMDQDLPEMMQGPINYWNSWGQAFTAMNEAGQTGKMEIQDFYNIVGEMNNLMAASGETLQLGAYKLDGSAESAAALIEAGMGALTNIDGKGVKINLNKIGVDFTSGAEGMNTNLQEGIRTLAQSQIDMLDAAIKMLEVVVAMEDLGNIDVDNNGVFSIGDIFKLDENGNATDEYTDEYQNFADKLIKQSETNEDLKEALETIKVDGITLKEMFDDASNGVKKLNISSDTYFSIMEAFVKAFQSGDYDLDTIQDSVWEVLNELMPDGTTIDVGERTVVVSGGTKLQLDWESENTKEALERITGKDEEEKKNKLKELVTQYLNNDPISVDDTITVLIATNKITIEDNGTYTTEDGSNFSDPLEAIRYQQMKDAGADNLTKIHDDKGYFIGYEGELKVGDKIIKVSNVGGKTLYHSDTLNRDYESLDELIHQEFLYARHYGFSGDEEDYAELTYGIKIKTKVKIENQETWDNRTKGQNDELIDAILSGDMSKIKDAASEVGLTIKANSVSDMTQEEYNQLLELAGIENKTTIMNLQVNASESSDPRLVELVTSDGAITKEMELDLTTTGDLSENFINAINNLNPTNLAIVAFNLAAMSSSLKTISGATFQNVDDMKTRWDEILAVVKEVAEAIAAIGDIKLPTPSGNGGGNGGGGSSSGGGRPEVIKPSQAATRGTTDQATGGGGGGFSFDYSGVQALSGKITELNTNATTAEVPLGKITTDLSSIQAEQAESATKFTGAINDIKVDGVTNAGNYKDAVNDTGSSGADNAKAFKEAVTGIPDKSGAINNLVSALNKIGGTFTLALKVVVTGPTEAAGNVKITSASGPNGNWHSNTIGGGANYHYSRSYAKGNAYAAGRKTLMGELGPELVVSHGRYFVVGQGGPEMVDLADDAIVFNHLQTRKLLSNGKISSHGSPITNERNATSFATGNMEGNALASASAALAALKQLRQMWQSMLEASLADLGRTAGPGGGGGGGSSGGGDNKKRQGFLKDIERWYNFLRRIEKLQERINILTKEQNILENDRIANGRLIYQSIRERIRLLEQERDTHQALADAQQEYYEAEQQRFHRTGFDRLYDFNEDGVLELLNNEEYAERMREAMRVGITQVDFSDIAGSIQAQISEDATHLVLSGTRVRREADGTAMTDDEGHILTESIGDRGQGREITIPTTGLGLLDLLQATTATGEAEYNAEEQFAILRALGFDKDLLTDASGNKIFAHGINNATTEEMYNAVQAWFEKMDQWRDHFDGLSDSIQEQTQAALDLTAQIQELENKLIEDELKLEKQVFDALKDRRQSEIDKLKAERDAFSEAAEEMINGLTEQLDKDRKLYQTDQNKTELEKLQRQLGILQRSGGSASQIKNLQDQIRSKQQDIYFDERQQQIDAIKEASDKQIEKLDQQIDIMERTLQYEIDNGLLWAEVREIMRGTPEAIAEYIATYSSEHRQESALQQEQETIATTELAGEYREGVDDKRKAKKYAEKFVEKQGYKGEKRNVAQEAYEQAYLAATGTAQQRREAAQEAALDAAQTYQGEQYFKKWAEAQGITSTKGKNYNLAKELYVQAYKKAKKGDKRQAGREAVLAAFDIVGEEGKRKLKKKKVSSTTSTNSYATGGLVTETGPAWLDGTKQKPEYILNAKQTAFLRDELLTSRDSLSSLVSELQGIFSSNAAQISSISNSNSTDSSIKIEHLEMSMNVESISSDYDVERATEAMFNKMTKIARKAGTRSILRG